jgi:hypothetical protein
MQARHIQDDHARLPAHRPGEGRIPLGRGERAAASTAVAVAAEEPGGAADAVTAASVSPAAANWSDAAEPTVASELGRRMLTNLDVLVIVPAVLAALALGAPALGVLVGGGAWLLQRLVAVADRKVIVRSAEPGSRLGLNFIDSFARIWLLAGGIVVAGAVGSHEDGLAAALVIFAAYSIAFAVRIGRGREGGPG